MIRFRQKNLHAFQFKCLRRILRIIWRAHTGHNTCQKNQWRDRKTSIEWAGHVLHVSDKFCDCIVVVGLQPGGKSRSLTPSLVWLNAIWQPHHSAANQLRWPAATCNIHRKYDVIVLVHLPLSFFTLSLHFVMLTSLAFFKGCKGFGDC